MGLLGFVVLPAQTCEVAFAGESALLVRHGVVEVAPGGGAVAAGEAAGAVADDDQVAEGAAGPVGPDPAVVAALISLQPLQLY